MKKGVILIVLDGFGVALPGPGNAIFQADPQELKRINATYPHTQLKASGVAVGLPEREVGSTEVGHLNLGAGRVVFQSLPRIDLSIADGSFYTNEAFVGARKHVQANNSALHIIGLVGKGTVHSSINHLYALLYFCKEQKFNNVYVHCITDGRDSSPQDGIRALEELENKMQAMGIGKIASVMGRYYAMDRDQRWDRIQKAYDCLTGTENLQQVPNWKDMMQSSYDKNVTDEFIEPVAMLDPQTHQPYPRIQNNDAVVFFNFRIDRPRELTRAFTTKEPPASADTATFFQSKKNIENLYFATMTQYDASLPVHVAFKPQPLENTLGKVLSDKGKTQLRLAESEKERFVTIYFSGLHEESFVNEDVIIVPSPKVPTYDLKPEMSSFEITDELIKAIQKDYYDFIVVNYAAPDMVAHTGNLNASIQAVNAIDECLKKIMAVVENSDYTLMVTADHGNIEEMLSSDKVLPSTEHSDNLVPFIIISKELQNQPITLKPGILADVAPTVLALLDVPVPIEMTGRNILHTVNPEQPAARAK